MEKTTNAFKEELKKIGFNDAEDFWKFAQVVQDAYFNICRLCLYGEAYDKLQKMEDIIYRITQGEHIDEDEADDVYFFYVNNYK